MSFFARARERRSAVAFDPTALTLPVAGQGSGNASTSGKLVDADAALTLETVYRGVQLISNSISRLPVNAVEETVEGTRKPLRQKPAALVRPFKGIKFDEGISQIVVSLLMRGNAYLVPVELVAGELVWRILSPDQVRVKWGSGGNREYRINGKPYDGRIEHLTTFMQPGAVTGAGIVEYCKNALGLGIALDEVAASLFTNGILSTGVIGIDAPLSRDDAKAVALEFQQNHSGLRKAHLPIVLGGGAKFSPMSLSPDDAQFIQSRQFTQGQFATLLGIPPHLLGIVDRTTSWGSGIEIQGRAFVDYTLRAHIHPIQSMLTGWLDDGVYAEFQTDSLTRADTATRYKNWNVALVSGWLNVDEVRALEGYPSLPGGLGQVYYQPQLSIPAQADLNSTAPAAAIPADDPNTSTPSGDPNAGDQN